MVERCFMTESDPTPRRRGRPPKNAEPETAVAEQVTVIEPERGSEVQVEQTAEVERELSIAPEPAVEQVIEVERATYPPEAQLVPAQHDCDPWGDTPMQARSW